MNVIIGFFRDTLSGFTYFINLIVCFIIFFACIGYMVSEKIYQTANSFVKKDDETNKVEGAQQPAQQVSTHDASKKAPTTINISQK